MMCRRWQGVLGFVLCLGLAGGALADPPEGKGKPDKAVKAEKSEKAEKAEMGGKGHKSAPQDSGGTALASAGISISLARQYAQDARLDFGAYKPLPPGIRKNLARGKPLPPGIAKQAAPAGMLSRLPQHPGYDWQLAGTDLILVQAGTAVVADVLKDVFR